MPVWHGADNQSVDNKERKNWWKAWRTIDFKHALTDTRLLKAKGADQELWQRIANGDYQQYNSLRDQHAATHLILVDAQLNADKDHLKLRLYGEDRTGSIDYSQEIPIDSKNLKQSYETVANIAFGILEGRWREPQITGDVVAMVSTSADLDEAASSKRLISETIFLRVTFRGLRDWQQIKKRLQTIPGVQKMQINSLSPRGADVRLNYPGGVDRFQSQLAAYQFSLQQGEHDLVLRSLK